MMHNQNCRLGSKEIFCYYINQNLSQMVTKYGILRMICIKLLIPLETSFDMTELRAAYFVPNRKLKELS